MSPSRIRSAIAIILLTLLGGPAAMQAAVCSSCNGAGTASTRCFLCKGSGINSSGFKCSSCNGRSFAKCTRCNGTGQTGQNCTVCTACQGAGTASTRCFLCKGTGINSSGFKCSSYNGLRFAKCTRCNGTGQTKR